MCSLAEWMIIPCAVLKWYEEKYLPSQHSELPKVTSTNPATTKFARTVIFWSCMYLHISTYRNIATYLWECIHTHSNTFNYACTVHTYMYGTYIISTCAFSTYSYTDAETLPNDIDPWVRPAHHRWHQLLHWSDVDFAPVPLGISLRLRAASQLGHHHLKYERTKHACITNIWLVVWNIFYFPIYWE